MKTKAKVSSGIILFLALLGLIIIALPASNTENKIVIEKVSINGNKYLTAEKYLEFGHLKTADELSGLKLNEVKDRLEKHPYVKFADVRFNGDGTVSATLHEKDFQGFVLVGGKQFLIDNNLNLIPLMPATNNIDLPVIENVKGLSQRGGNGNADLKLAAGLIYAAKLLDESLYNSISEVDMNNGGNVLIRFADANYVLKLGRGDEIRKLAYFDELYGNLKKAKAGRMLRYVDLRFKDEICLGFDDKIFNGNG